jgi:hypothetical protein
MVALRIRVAKVRLDVHVVEARSWLGPSSSAPPTAEVCGWKRAGVFWWYVAESMCPRVQNRKHLRHLRRREHHSRRDRYSVGGGRNLRLAAVERRQHGRRAPAHDSCSREIHDCK